MGNSRFDTEAFARYATNSGYADKSTDEILTRRSISPDLDPKGIKFRESRDSDANPNSTPIAIAFDVTGSMGAVIGDMVKNGLPRLMEETYKRKPVTDPHMLFLGVGDAAAGDEAPLQATQFEAGMEPLVKQTENIWLEKRGGGNQFESYTLPWYFVANHTKTDAWDKRQKKGYIFTMGDELPNPTLTAAQIKRVFGYDVQSDLPLKDVLKQALEKWEVFHIIIEQGSFCRANAERVESAWGEVLGQRAIPLADYTKLPEVIVSTIQLAEGADYDDVIKSWDEKTGEVVKKAAASFVGKRKIVL